ncbi:hypothetical protein NKR19_g1140 [Coniochaeta hoffmannii]|uniref:Uncharacterized protein n=1 Tax=Coniochaeta hoffmannii TaxID=91930 RepID=A0AA38W155_9PEZI|nr:hypothetical protein NKR19_g1140 [Coniochaeta hoffmannii]
MLTLHPEGRFRRTSSTSSLPGCSSELQTPSTHPPRAYPPPSMARTKPSHSRTGSSSKRALTDEKLVAQALETARESEEGAQDAQVCTILDDALSRIWIKIQAHPDSYVMSQTEMSVFTYFQYSFAGNDLAVAARKRYWDNMRR